MVVITLSPQEFFLIKSIQEVRLTCQSLISKCIPLQIYFTKNRNVRNSIMPSWLWKMSIMVNFSFTETFCMLHRVLVVRTFLHGYVKNWRQGMYSRPRIRNQDGQLYTVLFIMDILAVLFICSKYVFFISKSSCHSGIF